MSTLPDSIPDRASARFLDEILSRTRTDLTRRMQQTPRATLEQQALRHIVDGGVEPLVFQMMLSQQFSNDEEQHRDDDEHRQSGDADQKPCLLPPIGQRRGHGRGRDDRNRKMGQDARGGQPVEAVDRTGQTPRPVV